MAFLLAKIMISTGWAISMEPFLANIFWLTPLLGAVLVSGGLFYLLSSENSTSMPNVFAIIVVIIIGAITVYPFVKYGPLHVQVITSPSYIIDADSKKVLEVYDKKEASFRTNTNWFTVLKDQSFSQQCEKDIIKNSVAQLRLVITYHGLNQNNGSLDVYLDTLPKSGHVSIICRGILGLLQEKISMSSIDDNGYITDVSKEIINESSVKKILSIPDTVAWLHIVQ
jgi:hypothetical protein